MSEIDATMTFRSPAGKTTFGPVETCSRVRRKKEAVMVRSAFFAAAGLAAIVSVASAEDLTSATAWLPPKTFTTSAQSDEWKIANALSSGPASITEHAAVIDWSANPNDEMSHGRVLRQGS